MLSSKKYVSFLLGAFVWLNTSCAYAVDTAVPVSNFSTVLLKTDHSWNGVKYTGYPKGQPELTLLEINIPAHTTLQWHLHPMPYLAYVVSGTLRIELKDSGLSRTLKPGDVLAGVVNTVHTAITDGEPVKVLAFYAGVTDMPTLIPFTGTSTTH